MVNATTKRVQIRVKGTIEGAGLVPFVFNLAKRRGLTGYVAAETGSLLIEIEGKERAVSTFISTLKTTSPPLARIDSVEESGDLEPIGHTDFSVR